MRNRGTHMILAVTLAASVMSACGNSAPQGETVRVDLRALQMQLGITAGAPGIDAPKSAATDEIKTLVVGPLRSTNHGKKYSLEEDALTNELSDTLSKDIANTSGSMAFIPLPTTQEFVEFPVPTGASEWQVLAIASRSLWASTSDLGNTSEAQKESIKQNLVYYGVSDKTFNKAEELINSNLTLTLQRACLITNTPSGCATYNKGKDAIVTPSVEILGVSVNTESLDNDTIVAGIMPDLPWSFPIIVHDAAAAEDAKAKLNTLRQKIVAGGTAVGRLTIYTAHTENPAESDACKALKDKAGVTVSELRNNCNGGKPQKYFYVY